MKQHSNIVVFDVETTGLDWKSDYILQLSAMKIRKSDFKILDKWSHYIKPCRAYTINPQAEVTHGLTREFIEKNGEDLKTLAPSFIAFCDGCDIAGYNSNSFDAKFIYKDFALAGCDFPLENRNFYDAFLIEKRLYPSRLAAIFHKYTGKTMEEAGLAAHDAMSDVTATAVVLKKQIQNHNLQWEDIDEWQENNLLTPDGTIRNAGLAGEPMLLVMATGKHRDEDIYELCKTEPQYIQWANQNLFSAYTRKKIAEYLKMRTSQEKNSK